MVNLTPHIVISPNKLFSLSLSSYLGAMLPTPTLQVFTARIFPLAEHQFLAFPYLLVPLGKPCWGAWDRGLDPWESLGYNLFF